MLSMHWKSFAASPEPSRKGDGLLDGWPGDRKFWVDKAGFVGNVAFFKSSVSNQHFFFVEELGLD